MAVLKNGHENRVKGESLHDIPAACKFFGRRIKISEKHLLNVCACFN